AVDYICSGGELRGLEFVPTKDGLDVVTGKKMFESQGHQDQFIAEMGQWGMKPDRKFIVNGKTYTYMDFARHSKARASVWANQELSWAIIVIGQYLGTDISWTNSAGEKLKYEDLIRYELDQPIDGAACGGTHRLFGLSWAYYLHLGNGGKPTGVWNEVADKMDRYQKLARDLRNPDGSFSTKFFEERANASDIQARIYSTGHIFEWLALSLPDSELDKAWVQDAVSALSRMILEIQGQPMESGALYHAVHGLLISHARLGGGDTLGAQQPHLPLPPKPTPGRTP